MIEKNMEQEYLNFPNQPSNNHFNTQSLQCSSDIIPYEEKFPNQGFMTAPELSNYPSSATGFVNNYVPPKSEAEILDIRRMQWPEIPAPAAKVREPLYEFPFSPAPWTMHQNNALGSGAAGEMVQNDLSNNYLMMLCSENWINPSPVVGNFNLDNSPTEVGFGVGHGYNAFNHNTMNVDRRLVALPSNNGLNDFPVSIQRPEPAQQIPTKGTNGERKKGKKWTREEHIFFLKGIIQFGKGDWKKIANYMGSRSSTQVASHAQKHYIRQNKPLSERRRPSIHDITIKEDKITVVPPLLGRY